MSEKDEIMSIDEEDDGSSSSGDEDEEDTQEKAILIRAEELERQLSSNKYLYDIHIEIVDLYRKVGDLNSLREAYQRFHECFPLTPKLWLTWIRDEIKIAQTPEEQKKVFELFDKAVEDYLSIDLWIEYAQYSIGASNLETTRSILERGLIAGGLHTSEGSLLWDTLRELENAHVSLHEEGSEERTAQITRLADIFKRQLSVPLIGMENTFQEWQEWSKTLPEGMVNVGGVEWSYKKAKNLLDTYKEFEEKLLVAENDNDQLQQAYKEYIKIVKDPSTVMCLFERAIVSLCLVPDLWLDYCMFTLNLGETAVKVSGRALRNCPWSEDLWIMRLRILEHTGKNEDEVLALFEQGLSSIAPTPGLDLWLCYLEYYHRNTKEYEKLDKLFAQAIQQIGKVNDPSSKLSRFHARLLASRGEMSIARKIWNGIMNHPGNKYSSATWLEFANLERQHGDPNQLRSIFKRALSCETDWPQYIAEEWLMFERQSGTLDDVIKCTEKIKSSVKTQPVNFEKSTRDLPQQSADSTSEQKGKKRRAESNEKFVGKKAKYDQSRFGAGTSEDKYFNFPSAQKRIDKNPKKTVFISNLHVSATENMLKELFPNAKLIEIVKDRREKSRGYGYLQFSKEEEAMTALARDRVPLDGRPVFISELKPERTERKPTFKYPTTSENNKLFVKGLPVTKTKEDVEEIFKLYDPKDVRIVIKKSGQAKGIAYVEFEDQKAALRALKATDQMKLDEEHTISVVVSAPPPKKAFPSNSTKNEPIRHARSRLQLPLIPRSLQVKSSENGSKATSAPKSNADFRSMLLKK